MEKFIKQPNKIETESEHKYALESKKLGLEAGFLGKFFGVSEAAPINIAGLIAVLLIVTGVTTLFVDSKIPASNVWDYIIPIITMILGYLFGKKGT